MSIDADLGAGLIDETQARQRREEINRYADFYGAMDGAAKFVRGDAIAGLIITFINLIGGFIIGMAQRSLSAGEALTTYSSLTVGDGLVTQIPALIVSTAAGILVTYGSSGLAIAPSLVSQLTRSTRSIWTAAAILSLFAIIPGLPAVPFLLLSAGLGAVAYITGRRRANEEEQRAAVESQVAGEAAMDASPLQELLAVEPLELEIGYALVPLVGEMQEGNLLQRIGIMRKQLALEIGMVIPPTRIRDNVQLSANGYVIKLRGIRVAGGDLMPRHLLALDMNATGATIEGVPTNDPSFGMPAVWITAEQRAEAEAGGLTVVDAQTVLATHLMESIRDHAAELLSRQNVRELLDGLKQTHPALVEDVVPNRVSLGTVHRVLQRLLREKIPIRDLVTILEALSDATEQTKDPEALTEAVRRALSLVIVQSLGGTGTSLRGITVGPKLELALMQLFSPRPQEGAKPPEPGQLTTALAELGRVIKSTKQEGLPTPLVTPPALRVGIRRLIEPTFPQLPVISIAELPAQTPVQTVAIWELPDAA
jgi:flagellar biosynthesis protein FlhA